MCALFGYLDIGHQVPMKVLRKLLQALANASEVRGNDASGIAYNKNGFMTIYKRPKPAHKMRFRLPDGTTAVMGHTRMTTQGSEKNNYNNHPFRGHAGTDFALAHNGVLYNDRELKRQKQLPDTMIETDSYVAVQLIETQGKLNFDSIKQMAEEVCGTFTFTILDSNNTLWFVKGSSPLYLIYYPELRLYVYSSTREIMMEAIRNSPLLWRRHEVIDVDEGQILKITADGKTSCERFDPFLLAPTYKWYSPNYETADDDDALMDLIDIYACFGVPADEVIELWEMGYSVDEIEDFLFCPGAYERAIMTGEM